MMRISTKTLGLAVAVVVLVAAACVRGRGDAEKLQGEKAPDASAIAILSEDMFAEHVEKGSGVVLVDFWATWCGPCRYMNPIVESLGEKYAGRLKVAKIDVDRNQKLAERFHIQGIPTFMIFKDGKAVDMHVGAMRKEDFEKWVGGYAGSGA